MKYKLTDETKEYAGRTLHRIEALIDFADVKIGDKGGYVEREENLSHNGNAWVYGNARVYGDAWVSGNAWVYGDAAVYGNAKIQCQKDYIVFKNWWSSGRYFTWTRSNDMWRVGCFYGTGKELVEKAHNDSEDKGRNYELIVNYVENIKSQEQ